MILGTARVFVGDLFAAHGFYAHALGLPLHAGGPDAGFCVYAAGPCQLVVESVPPDAPPEDRALVGRFTGLSFTVDDIRAAYDRLRQQGITFTGAPEPQAWGGTLATLLDPAGNALQLVQPPGSG